MMTLLLPPHRRAATHRHSSSASGKNGLLIDNDAGITNIMVNYFSSVYTAPSNDAMPEMNNMYEREIRNMEVRREDIQARLEKLKVNKSCGPDDI